MEISSVPRAGRSVRVLLLQPPSEGAASTFLSHADEDSGPMGFKPPIGILYLATALAELGGHDVRVIDAVARRMTIAEVVREAAAFSPEIVGISAWTHSWFSAFHLGKAMKEALPGAHVTYGGPHAGVFPGETLQAPFADSVIVGDGEVPLLWLAGMAASGRFDSTVPGLHLKAQGVRDGKERSFVLRELDALPIPDRTLAPMELYGSVLSRGGRVTTMITSRGCPHRCVFCKLSFQKTLCRSAGSVVEEFSRIAALGIREVEVYDDTFTWSRQRVVDICRGLIESGTRVEWAIRDRVSSADPELLRLLHRAGCRRVHYGVESGVDRVLERMKKKITTEQARNAVRWARDAGLTVLTYFMFGNLDETVEDMRRTIDFALELDTDYAEFSVTVPYPGTELYEEALERGLIETDYWRAQALQPVRGFRPPRLIEQHASLETLLALRDEAHRRFYFRPRYLARQIVATRGLREFSRKARMGWRLAAGLVRPKKRR